MDTFGPSMERSKLVAIGRDVHVLDVSLDRVSPDKSQFQENDLDFIRGMAGSRRPCVRLRIAPDSGKSVGGAHAKQSTVVDAHVYRRNMRHEAASSLDERSAAHGKHRLNRIFRSSCCISGRLALEMERDFHYRRLCATAHCDCHILHTRFGLDNEVFRRSCDGPFGTGELRHVHHSIPDLALLAGIYELSSPRTATDCRSDVVAILCVRAFSDPLISCCAEFC